MKVAKLFVGDAQNANFAELGKKWFNPIYVDFGIGRTGAVTDVDGELEHGESIIYQGFPKTGGSFSVGLGFGGQIEKYQNPHDTIFTDATHESSG